MDGHCTGWAPQYENTCISIAADKAGAVRWYLLAAAADNLSSVADWTRLGAGQGRGHLPGAAVKLRGGLGA
jgi:hypothetical protein